VGHSLSMIRCDLCEKEAPVYDPSLPTHCGLMDRPEGWLSCRPFDICPACAQGDRSASIESLIALYRTRIEKYYRAGE